MGSSLTDKTIKINKKRNDGMEDTNYLIDFSSSKLLSSDSSSSSTRSWPRLYGASFALDFPDEFVLAADLCPARAVDWALVLLAIDVGL